MFGPDLYLLVAEVLIGSMTLLSLCAVTWIVIGDGPHFMSWLGRQIRRVFHRYANKVVTSDAREYLLFPVLAATVLGLGLAVQSIVDDIIDDKPLINGIVAGLGQWTLKSESGYRFSALFVESPPSSSTRLLPIPVAKFSDTCRPELTYRLSSLGRELLLPQKEIFAHALDPTISLHYEFYTNPDEFLSTASSTDARCGVAGMVAAKMYYDASAWAISQEPYRDMLRRWETQIDFLGALSLCAGLVVFVGLVVAFPRYVWTNLPHVKRAGGPAAAGHLRRRRTLRARSTMRVWCTALVLWWASGYGFIVAERNYIERALGLYASHHHFDEIMAHPLGCRVAGELIESAARACSADNLECQVGVERERLLLGRRATCPKPSD